MTFAITITINAVDCEKSSIEGHQNNRTSVVSPAEANYAFTSQHSSYRR